MPNEVREKEITNKDINKNVIDMRSKLKHTNKLLVKVGGISSEDMDQYHKEIEKFVSQVSKTQTIVNNNTTVMNELAEDNTELKEFLSVMDNKELKSTLDDIKLEGMVTNESLGKIEHLFQEGFSNNTETVSKLLVNISQEEQTDPNKKKTKVALEEVAENTKELVGVQKELQEIEEERMIDEKFRIKQEGKKDKKGILGGIAGLFGGAGKGAGKLLGKVPGIGLLGGLGKKGLGLLKGGGKLLGKVALPLAGIMAAFDFVEGWGDAAKTAGLKPGEIPSLAQKAKSGLAGALSGLTFGLMSAPDMYKKIEEGQELLFGDDGIFRGVIDVFKDFWEFMMGPEGQEIFEGMKTLLGKLVDLGKWLFSNVTIPLLKVIGIILESGVKQLFNTIKEGLKLLFGKDGLFSKLWDLLKVAKDIFTGQISIWDGIKQMFGIVFGPDGMFAQIFKTLKKMASFSFTLIEEGVEKLFGEEGIFPGIGKVLKSIGDWLGDKAFAVIDGIKSAIDFVFGDDGIFAKIGNLITKISDFSITDFISQKFGGAAEKIMSFFGIEKEEAAATTPERVELAPSIGKLITEEEFEKRRLEKASAEIQPQPIIIDQTERRENSPIRRDTIDDYGIALANSAFTE